MNISLYTDGVPLFCVIRYSPSHLISPLIKFGLDLIAWAIPVLLKFEASRPRILQTKTRINRLGL